MEELLTGGVTAGAVALALAAVEALKYKMNGKPPNGEALFHIKELRRETGDQTEILSDIRDELRKTARCPYTVVKETDA